MPKRIEVPEQFPVVGDVRGKRVVVTGAGRGLGELIAHALSRAGAKVALVARTRGDLAEVAGAVGGPTLQFSGDVRDPVAPGWFESPLADPWMRRDGLAKAVLDHTALNRWGRPGDLTGAFQFLASDAAGFVTGTVLNVDGGYLLS